MTNIRSLLSLLFLWATTAAAVSTTNEEQPRILQESTTRTDLVRLIPFDVQIALSYGSQDELENINVVALTDIITDWMSESFTTKSTSQLLDEAESNSTSFDSVALELMDTRLQTSNAAGQPIALLTTSYEGVSLWERAGTALPMDPELVELMQRATFLEDNALLELLQEAPVSETGFPTQDSVIDVRAFITPPSSTRPPSGAPTDDGEDNKNLEIIIIIAIVVACLAFGLLIFAVVWAWKSDQKHSGSSKASSSKNRSSRMSRTSSKKKQPKKALTEESTPSPNAQDPLEGSEFDFGGANKATANTSNNKGIAPREEPAAAVPTTSDPYAADSVVSEDVSAGLSAYYKAGMYGSSAANKRGNNNYKDFNDAASMSSMDSYGYSLDGYAPSLGPAPQGGYPVGPLQAAKDAAITVGDEDEVTPAAPEEEVEDYEAQT